MAAEATRMLVCLAAAVGLSALAVLVLSRVAPSLGLVDVPGGRKAHARAVPLVGGIAIFVALLGAALAAGISRETSWFLLTLSVVITLGFWDDVTDLSPRLKIAIQVIVATLMIWGAGVELHGVGDILGWRPIGLTFLAAPLTVFAIVGVMNAVNMMDGLDGLGGSIAFVAFAWYAAVAAVSGFQVQFDVAVILCGAIAGFLLFNLRFSWQSHARVFLGDAGSLMIGFALGWFAIDLTQGPGRTFPPIAALWVLLLPLADCVSLMARRLRAGRSPFAGDRHHIHHYLLARGFTHNQALYTLVGVSAAFGAVGFLGWRYAVPDATLFWTFFAGFFAYHFWIARAWRQLEARAATAGPAPALEEDEVGLAG